MAKQNTKLELTWIGKENRPKLEPRILIEDAEKSYHAQHLVTDNDIFDNRLIFGGNLLALKALEQEFAGKIKCFTSIHRSTPVRCSTIMMMVTLSSIRSPVPAPPAPSHTRWVVAGLWWN